MFPSEEQEPIFWPSDGTRGSLTPRTIRGAGWAFKPTEVTDSRGADSFSLGPALAIARPAFADRQKPKIGYLSWFPESMEDDLDRFREGMEKAGFAEADYQLEAYFTGGEPAIDPGYRS
jgi:hypothetical protein